MPGPVEIAGPIREAFQRAPISHRSCEFIQQFEAVRQRLRGVTGAAHAALFQGSGTLANEIIACALHGPGVVLVNGEFGHRIAEQARAWDLQIRILDWPWGEPWDLDRISKALEGVRWVWGVHLETSTGMVNHYAALRELTRARGVRLCLDCVSSLGAIPVDLDGVWLASGVSGKALGSYAGVAVVFASEIPAKARSPVYLDLGEALRTGGPRFTFSSPLVAALEAALLIERDYAPLGALVRRRLRQLELSPLVDGTLAAPTVTTFAAPPGTFAERCRQLGYWIGGESGYLSRRGLLQIANMGAVAPSHIEELFSGLA
jgi:aspartate aminotransferase-like enzyme